MNVRLRPFLRELFSDIGAVALIMLLIFGAMLSWVAYREYWQAQEAEYRLLEAHARNAEAQVLQALAKTERLLNRVAAAAPRLRGAGPAALQPYRDELPEGGVLVIADAQGRIRSATNASLLGHDVSAQSWFTAQRETGPARLFMSRPERNLLKNKTVVLSVPVAGGHAFAGVVGIAIDHRFFTNLLRTINPDDSESMTVIYNREGDIVFRRENTEKYFGFNMIPISTVYWPHRDAGKPTTRHLGPSAINGQTRMFLVRDAGDSGLILILSRQLDEVLATWRSYAFIYAGIFLGITLVVVVLAVVAARRKREVLAGKAVAEQLTEVATAEKLRAEEANLAKSKFLAAVSHDLRQPIHALGLFLGAMARTKLDANQHDILAGANAASKASFEMLNALLDFSRIEAGVVEPRVGDLPLQPLLNKIEREFGPLAEAKGIEYRSRETNLAVRSDPMLMELILRNLVSNAIRYTRRGGVLVACRRRGAEVSLEVWDTGIGIAPENQTAVFREFLQLANPERDRQNGLGLGLAIADGLARTLGHRLSLASRLGYGSVFRLSLPLAAECAVETRTQGYSWLPGLEVSVLLIEDDEIVRDGMLCALRDWGCTCRAAESVDEALALAREEMPDLVVSDFRLRGAQNGLAAIAALRELAGAPLPALLITGDTAPDRLREATASGIPLLHKPVSPGRLYRAMAGLLSSEAPAGG